MSSKNSQCETIVPLLDAFVDSELDGSEKEQVLMHLQTCEDCNLRVKEIEALKTSLASLPRRSMSRDLADSFDNILNMPSAPVLAPNAESASGSDGVPVKEIKEEAGKPNDNVVPLKPKGGWIKIAAAAAAVALVALFGTFAMQNHQEVANLPDGNQPAIQAPSSRTQPAEIAENSVNTGSGEKSFDSAGEQNVKDSGSSKHGPSVSSAHNSLADNNNLKSAEAQHHDATATESSVGISKTFVAEKPSNSVAKNSEIVATVNAGVNKIDVKGERNSTAPLVALYDEDEGVSSDIGMTTDEDGLYAIKL